MDNDERDKRSEKLIGKNNNSDDHDNELIAPNDSNPNIIPIQQISVLNTDNNEKEYSDSDFKKEITCSILQKTETTFNSNHNTYKPVSLQTSSNNNKSNQRAIHDDSFDSINFIDNEDNQASNSAVSTDYYNKQLLFLRDNIYSTSSISGNNNTTNKTNRNSQDSSHLALLKSANTSEMATQKLENNNQTSFSSFASVSPPTGGQISVRKILNPNLKCIVFF
jgi:hypothetical protein